MILRPYQTRFVEKMNAALKEKGNSLGIAATGAGKTIMLAAVTKRVRKKGKALILQHRDELGATLVDVADGEQVTRAVQGHHQDHRASEFQAQRAGDARLAADPTVLPGAP